MSIREEYKKFIQELNHDKTSISQNGKYQTVRLTIRETCPERFTVTFMPFTALVDSSFGAHVFKREEDMITWAFNNAHYQDMEYMAGKCVNETVYEEQPTCCENCYPCDDCEPYFWGEEEREKKYEYSFKQNTFALWYAATKIKENHV